jgi:tripartite-type tricarboxylate transporter receptor subunit TctC
MKARSRSTRLWRVAVLPCLALLAGIAAAQSYPARPIRLIVPFAPGGGVDFVSRALAQKLSEGLGQSIIIDNRGGAGGIVGSELVARAAPDGYTLLMANNSTHAVLPSVTPRIPYDSLRDFTPVSLIASTQNLLVANTALPARTVREFIDLTRSKPGAYVYGSAGEGSQTHLAGELLQHVTGIRMTHVPYKGAGPGYIALLGGEIQVMFGTILGSLQQVQSGRIRALAITGEKRSPALPTVPTFLEQDVAKFETGLWYALLGPARMPPSVSTRLRQEIVKAMQHPDLRKVLVSQGSDPVGSTPEECVEAIRKEIAIWTGLVKETGIRLNN